MTTRPSLWVVGSLGAAVGLWLYSRTAAGEKFISQSIEGVDMAIRGIRNNNPGNIKITGAAWLGKISPNTDGTFEQFDTMEHGVRAIAVILKNYQTQHGLNTVRGIISRWSATDQDAYISNVAVVLGVDIDESIDLLDSETLSHVVEAVIKQENGIAGYALAASAIDSGVRLA